MSKENPPRARAFSLTSSPDSDSLVEKPLTAPELPKRNKDEEVDIFGTGTETPPLIEGGEESAYSFIQPNKAVHEASDGTRDMLKNLRGMVNKVSSFRATPLTSKPILPINLQMPKMGTRYENRPHLTHLEGKDDFSQPEIISGPVRSEEIVSGAPRPEDIISEPSWTPKNKPFAFESGEGIEPISTKPSVENTFEKSSIFSASAEKLGASKERAVMKEAETEYLSAYKDFYKKNGALGGLKKSPQLESLKRKYNESRIKYQDTLDNHATSLSYAEVRSPSFEARINAKYEKLVATNSVPTTKNGEQMTAMQYVGLSYAEREKRVSGYLSFREVERGFAQKRINARVEGLDAKGKNIFEKSLGQVSKANQLLEKKLGKNGARAARALASAVVIGGVAAGSGAFAVTGAAGMVGFGAYKFARSFGGTVLGASLGQATAELYESVRGRKHQEASKAELKGLKKGTKFASAADLERADANRAKLIKNSSEAELQKKKALITAFTAMGVGAASSAAFAELFGVQHAAETLAKHAGSAAGATTGVHEHVGASTKAGVTHPTEHAPAGKPGTPHEAPAAKAAAVHPAEASKASPLAHPTEASKVAVAPSAPEQTMPPIHLMEGRGADSFFGDLHKYLNDGTPHPKGGLVDTILNPKNSPQMLARTLGFPENNSEGVMFPGDTLVVDHGKLLYHHGGRVFTLMEEVTDKKGVVSVQVHHDVADLKGHLFHKAHVGEHHHATHAERMGKPAPTPEAHATETTTTAPPASVDTAHPAEAAPTPEAATAAHSDATPETPDHSAPTEAVPDTTHSADTHASASPDQAPDHPASDTTAAAPETAPVEQVSAPTIEYATPSIDSITHDAGWSHYSHDDSTAILTAQTDPGTPADSFRSSMMDVLKESGVGPNVGETAEHYIARAAQVMHETAQSGMKAVDAQVGMYSVDGHLVVHGGDIGARSILAKDYQMHVNANAEILIENPGAKAPLLVAPTQGVPINGQTEYVYAPSDIKLSAVTEASQKVY
jgi:hypothetical protein